MSHDATTKTTVHDDGTFRRTALVVDDSEAGSVDVVDARGVRLCQINISHIPRKGKEDECLIVDVIDVDRRYTQRRALVFSNRERKTIDVPHGGNLVSTDFRR